VTTDPQIVLDCPSCHKAIYASISWFKQTYSTCPHCEQGVAASQFEATIADLEQAMDESIEEMLHGQAQAGCCGSKSSCGCKG
jgi:hypothetical protein